MKMILVVLVWFVSVSSWAGTPYLPEVDNRLNTVETKINNTAGSLKLKSQAVWNAYSTSGMRTLGDHDLSVDLPAHSIITDAYAYVERQVVGPSSKIGFFCGDRYNILTPTSLTGIGSSTVIATNRSMSTVGVGGAGTYLGIANNMTRSSSTVACDITARIEGAVVTDGKITLFVEYVVAE